MHKKADEAVVCFYMHPWEFVPMPGSIKTDEAHIDFIEVLWKNTGDYACRQLERLIAGLVERGSDFVSMKDYAEKHR